MWVHLSWVQNGHARVPNFPNHLKQNNDFAKLLQEFKLIDSFSEKYLPKHMRLNFFLRLFRFSFTPLAMLVLVMIFNSDFNLTDLKLCNYRKVCLNYCESDNFPNAACTYDYALSYKGNTYNSVFLYSEPGTITRQFQICRNLVAENQYIEQSLIDSSRQKRVHSCFYGCSQANDGVTFIGTDPRSPCPTSVSSINSLYCVDYHDTCENSSYQGKTCSNGFCFSVGVVALVIFIADVVQLIFEVSLYYSRSIVEKQEIDQISRRHEGDDEAPCYLSTVKCISDSIFLCLYAGILFGFSLGVYYYTEYGPWGMIFSEFMLAYLFDQIKSFIVQPIIWIVIVRRCNNYRGNFTTYDPIEMQDAGKVEPILLLTRRKVKDFLEIKAMKKFINVMVIILCISILSELSLGPYLTDLPWLDLLFYIIDFILLSFFVLEILLRLISLGFIYYSEFINLFDALIVIISFAMLFFNNQAKALGILRVMRLVKVVIEMKRQADLKKQIQKVIKEQKRQSAQFDTNAEIVADILERAIEQHRDAMTLEFVEDLQWVIDTINKNKNTKTFQEFDQSKFKAEEHKIWMDKIAGKITISRPKAPELKLNDSFSPSEHYSDTSIVKKPRLMSGTLSRTSLPQNEEQMVNELMNELGEVSQEEQEMYDQALSDIDQMTFDSFQCQQIFGEKIFMVTCFVIFAKYPQLKELEIPTEKLSRFLKKIREGYSIAKAHRHSISHVVDSIQGIHYFLSTGKVAKNLKPDEIFALYIAGFVQDYEHPGLTNQFLIKTRHPLANRYHDIGVLENYHVASAFQIIFQPEFNFLATMKDEVQLKIRKHVIDIVLNTELSKSQSLLGELQEKVSGVFPSESQEDKVLLMSLTLRCADLMKTLRTGKVFFKWMDLTFEEFFGQGDLEKQLKLPVSKFMDRDTTKKQHIYMKYIEVIAQPILVTYSFLVPEPIAKLINDQLQRNKKALEQRLDSSDK